VYGRLANEWRLLGDERIVINIPVADSTQWCARWVPHLIIAAKDLCRTCALQGVISILELRMSGVFTNHARAGKRPLAQTAEPAWVTQGREHILLQSRREFVATIRMRQITTWRHRWNRSSIGPFVIRAAPIPIFGKPSPEFDGNSARKHECKSRTKSWGRWFR